MGLRAAPIRKVRRLLARSRRTINNDEGAYATYRLSGPIVGANFAVVDKGLVLVEKA